MTLRVIESVVVLSCIALAAAIAAGQTVKPEEVEAQQKAQYEQIERYLDRQIARAEQERKAAWQRDLSSVEAYERSIEPWREKLWEMLGGKEVYAAAPLNA